MKKLLVTWLLLLGLSAPAYANDAPMTASLLRRGTHQVCSRLAVRFAWSMFRTATPHTDVTGARVEVRRLPSSHRYVRYHVSFALPMSADPKETALEYWAYDLTVRDYAVGTHCMLTRATVTAAGSL